MSVTQSHITMTEEITYPFQTTSGTPSDALGVIERSEKELWKQAIDEMLGWYACNDEDAPESAILDTAIDFAWDQMSDNSPAPASIVPSGNGCIAMEWNDGSVVLVIEFTNRGEANYTRFQEGCVVESCTLRRNPKSRQLETKG